MSNGLDDIHVNIEEEQKAFEASNVIKEKKES